MCRVSSQAMSSTLLRTVEHPQGDVFQIADRRRADVQHASRPAPKGSPGLPGGERPAYQSGAVPKLGAGDAHAVAPRRNGELSHHVAGRSKQKLPQISHPAANDDHLGVERVGHVHQPHAQPAGQFAHCLESGLCRPARASLVTAPPVKRPCSWSAVSSPDGSVDLSPARAAA